MQCCPILAHSPSQLTKAPKLVLDQSDSTLGATAWVIYVTLISYSQFISSAQVNDLTWPTRVIDSSEDIDGVRTGRWGRANGQGDVLLKDLGQGRLQDHVAAGGQGPAE